MIQGRYGVALTFRAPVVKAGGDDFAVSADWTPATGDVKISKDGANVGNITTLPSAVGGTGSALWSWPLSATEMEALEVLVQTVDSATKAVKDQGFRVVTLPPGAYSTGKAQGATASTIQLAAAENFGADDRPAGWVVEIHGGTGLGQARVITSYANTTDTATISPNWTTNPDNTSLYTIWPAPPAPTASGAIPAVNVTTWSGTAVATPDTAGHPKVTVKSGTGTGEVNLSGGNLAGSVASVTGAVGSVTGAVGSVSGNVTGSVGSLAAQAQTDVRTAIGLASANLDTQLASIQTDTDAIEVDTQDIQSRIPAALVGGRIDATVDGTGMEAGAVTAILTTAMTEAYAADGAAPTLAQALFAIQQFLQEKAVSGTTLTVKKLDGSTTAMTFTLNDATTPTTITRAT